MIRGIPAPVFRLAGARLARSLAQGALVVDFALYTRHIGWSAGLLGLILALAMGFNAVLTALIGPLSDRIGRKGFVLSYEALSLIAGGIALITKSTAPLAFAAIIGGFGRGANGGAGPFAPAEQAWITGFIGRERMSALLSINTGLGFLGMAAGAILAGVIGATRILFFLPVGTALIAGALLIVTPDHAARQEKPRESAEEAAAKTEEHGLLWRLAGLNLLNGVGIGLVTPLISWWFAVKFHQGAEAIGPALAASFVLAGIVSLASAGLAERFGTIRTVVVMRLGGLAALFALPFMPSFTLAAAAFAIRSAFNQGTAGARQAVALNLVRGHRHGLAASVNALSVQVPRGIAPAISGLFFDSNALELPFLIAGAFQGAYLLLYPLVFGRHDPTRRP